MVVLVALIAAWMTAGPAAAAGTSTVAEICACNAIAYTYGGSVHAYDAPAGLSDPHVRQGRAGLAGGPRNRVVGGVFPRLVTRST